MGLSIITPATTSPISDAEVKALAKIEDSSFDAWLAVTKPAAISAIEELLGRPLAPTVYELVLDEFTDTIELPRGPVTAVASLKYIDAANVEQTVSGADYTVDLVSDPQWLVRNSDYDWPTPMDAVNVVKVRFTAGYSSGTVPLPAPLKLAVGGLVKHWFEKGPEAAIPQGIMDLIAPWRSLWICA